jgi:hypothetical protein
MWTLDELGRQGQDVYAWYVQSQSTHICTKTAYGLDRHTYGVPVP